MMKINIKGKDNYLWSMVQIALNFNSDEKSYIISSHNKTGRCGNNLKFIM